MSQGANEQVQVDAPSLRQVLACFFRLGWLAFGGPVGQLGLMHADCVEGRGWLTEEEFLRALNFCHVLPGPEALQMAIYIGYRLRRSSGSSDQRRMA